MLPARQTLVLISVAKELFGRFWSRLTTEYSVMGAVSTSRVSPVAVSRKTAFEAPSKAVNTPTPSPPAVRPLTLVALRSWARAGLLVTTSPSRRAALARP